RQSLRQHQQAGTEALGRSYRTRKRIFPNSPRSSTSWLVLLSDRYAELRVNSRVRDQAMFLPLRIPNEIELQARWFAGEFGRQFISSTGEAIEIVQFGTWNRESGPD